MFSIKVTASKRQFMNKFNKLIGILFNSIVFFGFSLSYTYSQSSNYNRDSFYYNYEKYYLGSEIKDLSELDWTGNVSTCTAGTISKKAHEKILQRIFYFRTLVGLKKHLEFDEEYSNYCQDAALMMKANNALDHNPPTSWKCYTTKGAFASSSNLALGSWGHLGINSFIVDNGINNYSVGHRRWLLYPRNHKFSSGSTDNSLATYVRFRDNDIISPYPEFIAYPSSGYFPKTLIPNGLRWSFSKKDANFSNVIIEIRDENNKLLAVKKEIEEKGYGDNTVVFIPSIGNLIFGKDYLFSVSIKNVDVGGIQKNYDYKVLVIDPSRAIFNIKEADCSKANGSIKLISNQGYKNIKWSNGLIGIDSIVNLTAGKYIVSITDKLDFVSSFEIILNNKSINPPMFSYTCDSIQCNYDTVCKIKLGNGYKSYLWNTGEIKNEISIKNNNRYIVTITDVNNCQFILTSRPTTILGTKIEYIHSAVPTIKAYPPGCKYVWYYWSMGKAYKIYDSDEYQEIPTDYGEGLYTVNIECDGKICTEYLNVIMSNINNTQFDDINVSPNPTTGELCIKIKDVVSITKIKLFYIDGTNIINKTFQNSSNINLEIIGSPGIYLLYVNVGNRVLIKKILKF